MHFNEEEKKRYRTRYSKEEIILREKHIKLEPLISGLDQNFKELFSKLSMVRENIDYYINYYSIKSSIGIVLMRIRGLFSELCEKLEEKKTIIDLLLKKVKVLEEENDSLNNQIQSLMKKKEKIRRVEEENRILRARLESIKLDNRSKKGSGSKDIKIEKLKNEIQFLSKNNEELSRENYRLNIELNYLVSQEIIHNS